MLIFIIDIFRVFHEVALIPLPAAIDLSQELN